jgi:hypothetical protein
MSVEILYDSERSVASLYCTTDDVAFGPIFRGAEAREDAEAFLEWLPNDPREYPPYDLVYVHRAWLATRAGVEIPL